MKGSQAEAVAEVPHRHINSTIRSGKEVKNCECMIRGRLENNPDRD
jgi:hypothetical protein